MAEPATAARPTRQRLSGAGAPRKRPGDGTASRAQSRSAGSVERFTQPAHYLAVDCVGIVDFKVMQPVLWRWMDNFFEPRRPVPAPKRDREHDLRSLVEVLARPPEVGEAMPAPQRDLALGQADVGAAE